MKEKRLITAILRQAHATEAWTLSPDRKTLAIDRVIANDGDGGHGTSKAVYHRE